MYFFRALNSCNGNAQDGSTYHPRPIHCPKKMNDMNAENTVWNGLNIDTNTGPLRPMLETWNVVHRPITTPPCSSTRNCRLGEGSGGY